MVISFFFIFGTVLGFLVNLFWVYGYFVFIFGTVLGFLVNLFWVYVISFLLSVGILLGLWAFDFDGRFKIY
jgi:hypothetical protein